MTYALVGNKKASLSGRETIMSWSRMSMTRLLALCLSSFMLAASVSVSVAVAHSGHSHDSGRIPGRPDYQRIGNTEIQFHPKAGAYTYKRGNAPVIWFHADAMDALGGAAYALPSAEEPVVCATSGHRIKIMYSTAANPYTPTPTKAATIRSYVRRMNAKIISEAMRSSDNAAPLRMRVDCEENGEIRIYSFQHSTGEAGSLFLTAHSTFGSPSGADSVKNLIFYDAPDPNGQAAGVGQLSDNSTKSSAESAPSGNPNRYQTKSAVVYNGYWGTHTTLHELFHTMGAVQDDAPYSTPGFHCWTGHDVMCYDDDGKGPVTYDESYCPTNSYFETAIGVPLDCNYDSYFDASAENEDWLDTHWNVGGTENPFLVRSPLFHFRNTNTTGNGEIAVPYGLGGDKPVVGDWNGDGVETVGVYRPNGNHDWYLRNSNSLGLPSYEFDYGDSTDKPVVGDWNGDGVDTIGIYRPSEQDWYLRNSNSLGSPETQFDFGGINDIPIVGDWDGDGDDTIGVYRPSELKFYLRNTNSSGASDYIFTFGASVATPVAGDWDGDGDDTIGLYNSNYSFALNNENDGSSADLSFFYGAAKDVPVTGDWDSDGDTTIGVFRAEP